MPTSQSEHKGSKPPGVGSKKQPSVEKNRKMAGCWKIAALCSWPLHNKVKESSTHNNSQTEEDQLIEVMVRLKETLEGARETAEKHTSFIVNHIVGSLEYKIEYITLGPDHTYFITLSVAVCQDETYQKRDETSQTFFQGQPEFLHKMIPRKFVENGIMSCLKELSQKALPTLQIEFASNHPAVHLSSGDAAFCKWESGNDGK